MTAHWTNEEFESVIESDKLTFQNLVYKMSFKSDEKKLRTYLDVFQNPV